MTVHSRTSEWVLALRAFDHERAWDGFLTDYAGLILQVVHLFERDQDRIDDCFVFVCEQLKRDKMRRIRRFDTKGPASFQTWLRAVTRNLCLDWRRKRFGRPRLYRSIARLSQLDQELFRCIYLRGMSENEAFHTVKALHPALSRNQLAVCLTHIHAALTPRQQWLLASSHPKLQSLSSPLKGATESNRNPEIEDSEPDPEEEVAQRECLAALRRAMSHLPSQERLLLRLRYEQELNLEQIARLTRIGTPFKVKRALERAEAALRHEMETNAEPSVSVKDS